MKKEAGYQSPHASTPAPMARPLGSGQLTGNGGRKVPHSGNPGVSHNTRPQCKKITNKTGKVGGRKGGKGREISSTASPKEPD